MNDTVVEGLESLLKFQRKVLCRHDSIIALRELNVETTTSGLLFLAGHERLDVDEVAAFRRIDSVLLPASVVVLDDLGWCAACQHVDGVTLGQARSRQRPGVDEVLQPTDHPTHRCRDVGVVTYIYNKYVWVCVVPLHEKRPVVAHVVPHPHHIREMDEVVHALHQKSARKLPLNQHEAQHCL
jgi:hypothetical protein